MLYLSKLCPMVQPDVEATIVTQGLTQRGPLQRYTSNQDPMCWQELDPDPLGYQDPWIHMCLLYFNDM